MIKYALGYVWFNRWNHGINSIAKSMVGLDCTMLGSLFFYCERSSGKPNDKASALPLIQ